jgi:hypothetical protein
MLGVLVRHAAPWWDLIPHFPVRLSYMFQRRIASVV